MLATRVDVEVYNPAPGCGVLRTFSSNIQMSRFGFLKQILALAEEDAHETIG